MTEPRDWDKELAKVDKAIARQGVPHRRVEWCSGGATDATGARRPRDRDRARRAHLVLGRVWPSRSPPPCCYGRTTRPAACS